MFVCDPCMSTPASVQSRIMVSSSVIWVVHDSQDISLISKSMIHRCLSFAFLATRAIPQRRFGSEQSHVIMRNAKMPILQLVPD
jgi:hypothetical protein